MLIEKGSAPSRNLQGQVENRQVELRNPHSYRNAHSIFGLILFLALHLVKRKGGGAVEATLSPSKNQATIPKSVRDCLNLNPATGSSSSCPPTEPSHSSQNQNRNPQGVGAPTEAARVGRGDERGP